MGRIFLIRVNSKCTGHERAGPVCVQVRCGRRRERLRGLGGWQGKELGLYSERNRNGWTVLSSIVTESNFYFNRIPWPACEWRVERGKDRHGQTSEEVPAVIQVSNSGSSEQSGDSGTGEKWSDSGSVEETEQMGLLQALGGRGQWMKETGPRTSGFVLT